MFNKKNSELIEELIAQRKLRLFNESFDWINVKEKSSGLIGSFFKFELGNSDSYGKVYLGADDGSMDREISKEEFDNDFIISSITHHHGEPFIINEPDLEGKLKTISRRVNKKLNKNCLVIAMEECSELQKETSKLFRGKVRTEKLIEEIADVIISIEFIKTHENISQEQIDNMLAVKLKKIENKLDYSKIFGEFC